MLSFLVFGNTHLQGRDVQGVDVWFSSSTSLLLGTGRCFGCAGSGFFKPSRAWSTAETCV